MHLNNSTSCETLCHARHHPLTADCHHVEVHPPAAPFTGLGTLAVGVITIAALYFGREVFVPMALALLLSFALGPAVLLLRRWRVNRVLAVISVKEAASAGLEGENLAPAIAPLAAANGDTLVERQANRERVTVALPS